MQSTASPASSPGSSPSSSPPTSAAHPSLTAMSEHPSRLLQEVLASASSLPTQSSASMSPSSRPPRSVPSSTSHPHSHHNASGRASNASSGPRSVDSTSSRGSVASAGHGQTAVGAPSAADPGFTSPRENAPYTITAPFPMRLPEYTDATRIFESKHTIVYHATRVSDGLEVVLKVPNSRSPGRSRLLVFGQQYELLKSIEAQAAAVSETEPSSAMSSQSHSSAGSVHGAAHGPGSELEKGSSTGSVHSITPATQHSSLSQGVIRAYDLISIHNTLILVCEYFNGPSLHSYLSTAQYSDGFPLVEFLCVGIKMSHVLYDIHQQSIIHRDITASNILYSRTTGEIKVSARRLTHRPAARHPLPLTHSSLHHPLPVCDHPLFPYVPDH